MDVNENLIRIFRELEMKNIIEMCSNNKHSVLLRESSPFFERLGNEMFTLENEMQMILIQSMHGENQ
jgi:hypothetical protein